MVKRTSHQFAACPMARALDVLGDWWSLLIIRDAFGGITRFGQFQKSLGLAKNILSSRLRNLVAHGILELKPCADNTTYKQYILTEKGRRLFPLLVALRQWGEDYFCAEGEEHVVLIDREKGEQVRRLELRARDGRLLQPEDTLVSDSDTLFHTKV